jgi:hypothetical protein
MANTSEPVLDWDPFGDRVGIARMPRRPERSELSAEELEAWDEFQKRFQKIQVDKRDHPYRHRIAGGFFGLMCSPTLPQALTYSGRQVMNQQGKEGSFSAYDHELIDLVLSFDSGHWGLIANHVPFAIASGVSFETVEALRDGREDELTDSDRQVVAFIRAVRDGTVTDELYEGMKEHFGSERGIAEFAFLTLTLLTHLRLIQLFDEPQITPEEFEDELALLRAGNFPMPEVEHHGPPQPAGSPQPSQ